MENNAPALIPAPTLDEQDAAFASRLMSQPRSGLAWASEVLRSPHTANHLVAVWCCLQMDPSWTRDERQSAHRARMGALAHKKWGPLFAQELPRIWISEQKALASGAPDDGSVAGVELWISAFADLVDHGVDPRIGRSLAQQALAAPMVKAALDAKTSEEIDALFDQSVGLRSAAPGEWQLELVSRLSASQCVGKLEQTYVNAGAFRRSQKMARPTRDTCERLATKALADPDSAYRLLQGFLMGGVVASFLEEDAALAGVFDALAANPRPALGAMPQGRSRKLFDTFKGPLALSMELLCKRQFEAGVAAASWAVKLGARGQDPVGEITDGLSKRAVPMSVRLFESKGYSRGEFQARSLSDAAVLYRRADVCAKLRAMGWAWPGKERIAAMAKDVADMATRSIREGNRCYLDEDPAGVAAGTLAFWESLQMGKMLDSRPKEAEPEESAPRRGMRI